MIQDIDEKIKHSILSSFADDTRMMKGILSIIDVVKTSTKYTFGQRRTMHN